jgi:hypothetical protein
MSNNEIKIYYINALRFSKKNKDYLEVGPINLSSYFIHYTSGFAYFTSHLDRLNLYKYLIEEGEGG